MELVKHLVNLKPLETAGSTSSNRFNFQKNWALKHLLELHSTSQDYVFAFEFHDDVMVLDSTDAPKKAMFFQVKTDATKGWSLNRLISQKKGKAGPLPSILGKLFHHNINTPDKNIELYFVTNSHFSFKESATKLNAESLEEKHKVKIRDAMLTQLPELKNVDFDALNFWRTSLSLDGHETHIKGELHEFLKNHFGEEHDIPIEACYKSLTSEIKIKNDYSQSKINTVDDFYRYKCITKNNIEEFMLSVAMTKKNRPNWEDVRGYLISEGVGPGKLIKMKSHWRHISVRMLDSTDLLFNELLNNTRLIINDFTDDQGLISMSDGARAKLATKIIYDEHLFEKEFIQTLIIWCYCEQL